MQENMTSFVKESEPETIIPVVATCKLNEWCIVQPSSGTADRRFIDAWGMNHFNTCFQANTLQLAKKPSGEAYITITAHFGFQSDRFQLFLP